MGLSLLLRGRDRALTHDIFFHYWDWLAVPSHVNCGQRLNRFQILKRETVGRQSFWLGVHRAFRKCMTFKLWRIHNYLMDWTKSSIIPDHFHISQSFEMRGKAPPLKPEKDVMSKGEWWEMWLIRNTERKAARYEHFYKRRKHTYRQRPKQAQVGKSDI